VKIIGIDLGTTNSALAVASDDAPARSQPISQVTGPGEVGERASLPSFLLLPNELEVPSAQLQLPWSGPMRYAVGTFARERGAELPHRLVSSAKSWLCNPSIDRTAQVLPFRGAQRELDKDMEGGERVSPVNASARYLAHLRAAWDDGAGHDFTLWNHLAEMGVFGMLAIALMVFVLRQTSDDVRWAGIEKYVKTAFFGTNIGLAMMVIFSLFPSGVLQVWDVVQHGYWHARSLDYIGSRRAHLVEWLRLPGDLVFIVFGAIPLVIASIKGYFGARAHAAPGATKAVS